MNSEITGVILSGGRSSRMGGGDKGLKLLNGQPLFLHVLRRLRPQVNAVVISANRNVDEYQRSECKVIRDTLADYPGPLAGIFAALQAIDTEWAAFASCDTPYIPDDYVARLWLAKGNAPVVWVKSAQRDHPALSLINCSVISNLHHFLQQGERRVMHFMKQQQGHAVELKDDETAFMNLNTPEELLKAEGN